MDLYSSFSKYLSEVLGCNPEIDRKSPIHGVPYYILDRYKVSKARILNEEFVIITDNNGENTPDNIRKHIKTITDKTGFPAVYLHRALSSFNRKRLINYHVNFVVPGNQMFLPDLKIDLREYFKTLESKGNKIKPSTQAIVLYSLINGINHLDSKRIINELHYSAMTVSRAFREISELDIGELKKDGWENVIKLPDSKHKLWEMAYPYMESPVKSEIYLAHFNPTEDFFIAGFSALAEISMLAAKENTEYAINLARWNSLIREQSIKYVAEPEKTESNNKIQLWSYTPRISNSNRFIDKYSLYLSLKDDQDERIKHTLEDMLEEELNG